MTLNVTSARLQHVPPTLLPPPRAKSTLAVSDTTKNKAVLDHVAVFCPTSPHQRDVMKRQTGPFTVESKPAFILSDVRQAMYADFGEKHPSIKLSYSQYNTVQEDGQGGGVESEENVPLNVP